jgi:hypothetical protein
MRRIAPILTLAVIGALVVSACTRQQTGGGTVQATPEPPTSTATEAVAGEPITVTLDDQGKTIHLAVGESFLLKLGEEYTWDVSVSDENVLSRVVNITVVRGAQGVYDAHQAGTVTLSATGDPQCRQAQPPCAKPSIQFVVTIVVQ